MYASFLFLEGFGVLEVVICDNHRFFVGSLYPGWVNHMKCISGAQNYPQEISGRVFDDGLSEAISSFHSLSSCIGDVPPVVHSPT
ncbi:hypothetical protein Mhun_2431 [Methanospirillum hungatei JF-1]|uniref:Uncharacterized protein n=1 Tax=Methanospirillum hungatei JF-1 (strain ATCC 27890 / DSM 864 / NBRC 100397 / JF-1) TaxID=323259 RepID=Q2FSF8_METHJ|nr:hypothetical protein Mhun_2431 [Methanospirillum hungatei JF-1]